LNSITDKNKGYARLKEILKNEAINTSGLKEVHKTFPWVHSAIGNAKKILQGVMVKNICKAILTNSVTSSIDDIYLICSKG
jgi:hypothetical protein